MCIQDETNEFITKLYEEYYGKLRTYCLAYTGNKGLYAGDIEECIQEVFIVAYQKYDSLREYEYLEGWLKKACSFRMQKIIRARMKDFGPAIFSLDAPPYDVDAQQIDPIEVHMTDLSKKELLRFIFQQINENEKHLILDYWLKGMPLQELARQHHTSIGAIKNKLFRIRKKIKTVAQNFLAYWC